jgi:hypothetical protein
VLDQEYVRHVLERLRGEGMEALPSAAAAWSAFQTLGHGPEEFLRALGQLRTSASSGLTPDQLVPVIASTLRGSAADLELQKVEQIGGLAMAIFVRVARTEGPARGIFSAEAAAAYGEAIGREVRVEEIQPVVNELLAANVLMRVGHGLYGVSDPFVQETWREGVSDRQSDHAAARNCMQIAHALLQPHQSKALANVRPVYSDFAATFTCGTNLQAKEEVVIYQPPCRLSLSSLAIGSITLPHERCSMV